MLPKIAAGQGTPEPEQKLYTKPGGARSGGKAAGTLRGIRPAGVPPGTQCAPAPRFPAIGFRGLAGFQ